MSLLAYIVIALAIFGAGAAGGIKWEIGIVAARDLEAKQEADRMRVKRESNIDTAAVGHEADKRQIATEYVVITERIEDAKQTEFYAAGAPACFDLAGVRIVNDAARPRDAASGSAGAVPRPAAAAERSAGNSP